MNEAAIPCPVEDVQGDNRWMNLVNEIVFFFFLYLTCFFLYSISDLFWKQKRENQRSCLLVTHSSLISSTQTCGKPCLPPYTQYEKVYSFHHHLNTLIQLSLCLFQLNFGIGGDQTQHVLWRLSNGELDNIKPKVNLSLVLLFPVLFE